MKGLTPTRTSQEHSGLDKSRWDELFLRGSRII